MLRSVAQAESVVDLGTLPTGNEPQDELRLR